MFLKRVLLIFKKNEKFETNQTISFYEKMNEIHECALYLENFKHEIFNPWFEMFSMNNLAILRLFYGPKYSFPFLCMTL